MSYIIHDGPAVYVNADFSAVVDGSSPEAAFLLVGSGCQVPAEFVDLYLSSLEPLEPEKPADDAVSSKPKTQPARKPVKRTAKKSVAD